MLLMRYARILSIELVAIVSFASSAAAVESAHELAGYCQSLERGAKGAGLSRGLRLPRGRGQMRRRTAGSICGRAASSMHSRSAETLRSYGV